MKGTFRILLTGAAIAALVLSIAQARASELDDLAAGLDAAREPAEYARLAARLDLLACGEGAGAKGALTQLARAYYLLGEAEGVEQRRLAYLDRALDASELALKADPGDSRALYWRSMAYLQKADIEGGLSALGMVKRALKGFETVESQAPLYDCAGAYRSHGKVLMEAPAWAFIGDKKKGVELLEKAKELAPGALINRLYLAEAYSETGRQDEAVAELEYVAAAPLSETKPRDDIAVKEDAARLLAETVR